MAKLYLLSVPISIEPEQILLADIIGRADLRTPTFITTPNPEIVVEAQKNSEFLQSLLSSEYALPDGIGILFAIQVMGETLPGRIRGREFFEKLLSAANENKWNVYLLGGSQEGIDQSIARIRKELPDINVQGRVGPVLTRLGDKETERQGEIEKEIFEQLNQFRPHLIFVAFGHPKQELWVYKHKELFPSSVIMTIGGTLDTYSGIKPVAPAWMSKFGLEWLWRVIKEPTRLRRMFVALVEFPFLVLTKSFIRR